MALNEPLHAVRDLQYARVLISSPDVPSRVHSNKSGIHIYQSTELNGMRGGCPELQGSFFSAAVALQRLRGLIEEEEEEDMKRFHLR